MEQEPSVLDYVKSRLTPWKGKQVTIPALELEKPGFEPEPAPAETRYQLPWKAMLALVFALLAQGLLEPPTPRPEVAIPLYAIAAGAMIWAIWSNRSILQPVPPDSDCAMPLQVRQVPMAVGGVLLVVAFLLLGGNRFTALNVVIWLLAAGYLLMALWLPDSARVGLGRNVRDFFRRSAWRIQVTRWGLALLVVLGIAAFFRFYRLGQVPGEMFSDHAEKLLDVNDLLNGQTKIFFERNTGREFLQFYLTGFISTVFGTGLSFISLKLGTALAGFLTLPFIYKLGKEIGNRWVGLLALLLAGVAYWPNVISRIGLRFPLYPLFVAPTLFFLVRGLKNANRNDFILAGLALGLGLHGYSPVRILPLAVVAGVGVYLLHRRTRAQRLGAVWGLLLLAIMAFAIFLPLFRYAVDNPDMFNLRTLSRLGSTERPLPGPALAIFAQNLESGLGMFFWKDGDIWVHSIPNRPALDVVTAALFFLGIIIVIARYLRSRHWVDLFLLVSIPILMLPSTLSLAFPEENPSLNRTGGAIIPVFLIIAIALDTILREVKSRMGPRWGISTATVLGTALVLLSASQSYDLVLRQFDQQFLNGAWNTSDIGRVIRGFADSIGNADTAYVVPYPYWVDTRLVGINAGYPTRDYALWPENFKDTVPDPRTKLFILHPDDKKDLAQLTGLYPHGVLSRFTSRLQGKDFLIYLVPGLQENQP